MTDFQKIVLLIGGVCGVGVLLFLNQILTVLMEIRTMLARRYPLVPFHEEE